MKIILKIIPLITLITFSSCHSIGEELIEVPISKDEITSSGEISLKKGETISFWTKIISTTPYPDYTIKYLIEENKKAIEFDSISRFSGTNHIINATASSEDITEKTSKEKDTIIHSEKFEFEFENKKFTAPKDGKYTFDFKLTKYESDSESFFGSGMSIILRK
ncbi:MULTISPECIES: hypothetical protein [Flavobacterium]|uniref:Lipoprotein n=1 Tax=Flavobacterium salmonis TaxID=2654844 RepID=A0A6V6Z439_9FLAO|nr:MULTISPECIES: hypothetical protein [Flavobacterium]OOV18273.1 hypothetical protein BXU10_00730 [Flavobacterium sp. LM4]CAD0005692.1 hypothetical protein FLAT13_02904 [Flavobacterium salmonis]